MGGSSKPKKQTVGYHYAAGIHFLLCHGPIDGIRKIRVGDKIAWEEDSGTPDGTTSIAINEPNLFGGEDREGGIVGDVSIQYGETSQSRSSYLVEQIGSAISAYRGLVGVVLEQVRLGTSSYIKPWKFLCKRTDILNDGNEQWYSAKADIDGDLNPAHIIRECLTNQQWGLKYSTGGINSVSFEAAADTLYDEDFGLSFYWAGGENIGDFLIHVLKHVDGVIYQEPTTGDWTFTLIRDDYVLGDLDTYDESDIVSVEEFVRPVVGEVPDKITIRYTDNDALDIKASLTIHDIALIETQDARIIGAEEEYYGITKKELANKIASRELRVFSSMLSTIKIKAKRTMSGLRPGSVCLLSLEHYGLEAVAYRVVSMDFGSLVEGTLYIEMIEDVFLSAQSIFADPPATQWVDPISDPEDVDYGICFEAPYWSLFGMLGESALAVIDDDSGYLIAASAPPVPDAFDYMLTVRDGLTDDFEERERFAFTPTATIAEDLPMNAEDVEVSIENATGLGDVVLNTYALIGSELLKVLDIDSVNGTTTLARGVLDTVPAEHTTGDRIWFIESSTGYCTEEYTVTEQPGVKFLVRTGKGELSEAAAAAFNSDVFDSRMIRPYPPANFKINGSSYPTSFSGQPTLTWAHRDRTQQTASIIEQDASSIGPETGVHYELEIYDEGDSLIQTVTPITTATYVLDELDERSWSGLGSADPLNTSLRFVLKTIRQDSSGVSYNSFQEIDFTVARA